MSGEAQEGQKGQAPAFLKTVSRQASGYFVETGPSGGVIEGETLQCKHCQRHWKVQPGSGKRRGFCMNCMGPTCGADPCEARCVPFEKAIEARESRDHLFRQLRG